MLTEIEGLGVSVSTHMTSEKFSWEDLEYFKTEEKDQREISHVLEINRVFHYFENLLVKKKQPFEDFEDLQAFSIIQEHYRLLKVGKFSWEKEAYRVDKVLNLIKNSLARFDHPFDREVLDTSLIKLLFPLDLIDRYLSVVNRAYGKEVYDLALRLQTNLTKIFLFHHLRSDTRFNLHIATDSINVIDPFLRIKIREMNKSDSDLREKYFSSKFHLKKFVHKLLDLYFPNVACRYIGGGMEMHKYSLQIVLLMFELGFWDYEELTEFVNVLFQKLENLLKLEETSYRDFEKLNSQYEEVCTHLKMYFFECKEIVTAICLHIVLLMNDRAFMQSHFYFNPQPATMKVELGKCWVNAYFNNSEISNILHRILSMYVLRAAQVNSEKLLKKKTIQFASDLIMVITDIEVDICYASSRTVNQSMLEYYTSPAQPDSIGLVRKFRAQFINHLDKLASSLGSEFLKKEETALIIDLEKLLTDIAQKKEPRLRRTFQYHLAMQNVPKIIICIQNLLNELKASQESRIKCSLALIELCNCSIISQISIIDESGLKHLKVLFDIDPFATVIILEGIYWEDYSMMFGHRDLFKFLLSFYQTILKQFTDSQLRPKADRSQSTATKQIKTWFQDFKQSVLKDDKDNQLELLLTVFIYSRWICHVLENKDTSFELKFHEFTIQESICELLFDFSLKVVMDKEFLTRIKDAIFEEDVEYAFKPTLENANPGEINELIKKQKMLSLSETELKNTIFETSMMILKLMCKASSRFFTNYIYTKKVLPILEDLLPNTEYMFKLRGGCRYRAIVLELFTLFKVFPNNHLLSNREFHFQAPTSFCEVFIKEDHLSGELMDEICAEIKKINECSRLQKHNREFYSEGANLYFFEGLFPMIYKYCQGILNLYSRDSRLNTLYSDIHKLQTQLIDSNYTIRDRFGLNFEYTPHDARKAAKLSEQEAAQSMAQMDELLSLLSKGDSEDQKAESAKKKLKRRPDAQERLFPTLYEIREILLTVIYKIEKAYKSESDKKIHRLLSDLKSKTKRPTVISEDDKFEMAIASNIETDSRFGGFPPSERAGSKPQGCSEVTEEMKYFRALMEAYLQNKRAALSKPREQNILIKFLEGKTGSVENIIGFLIMNTNELFQEILLEDCSNEKAWDVPMVVFLQNEFMFSLITFLERIVKDCVSVKDVLIAKVQGTESGRNFLSLIVFIMNNCFGISLHKSFLDFDWKLIYARFKVINNFFKNLCDDNYTPFKKEFNQFKPAVAALKDFHKGHSFFYGSYVRLESSAMRFDAMNTSNRLMLGDRAELYPIFFEYIKLVTECVAGPYHENQMLIYTYRTDLWIGIVHRIIDDLNSNLYELKIIVLNYILALTEGNSETTCYFGANTTFDSLFNLIYAFLKRLYIYATVAQNKEKYAALVLKAASKYREQMIQEKEAREQEEKQQQSVFSFYSKNQMESHRTQNEQRIESPELEDVDEVFFDPNKSHIISKEIMESVELEDYKVILHTYMNNSLFCNHPLMKVVLRLNTLLMRLADNVAGYGICMENVYKSMINKYGEEVPPYIRSKLGNYERKKDGCQLNEKNVFYMFLTKITSEIEIRNPDTGNKVTIVFPLQPSAFFLSHQTKMSFLEKADHEDNIVFSLIESYPKFDIEMQANLQVYRRSAFLYKLSSDFVFFRLKVVVWSLGVLLNLVFVVFYTKDSEADHIRGNGDALIAIISILIFCIAGVAGLVWVFSRYRQKKRIAELSNSGDGQSPLFCSGFLRAVKVGIYDSFLKQSYPVFFIIHILSCFFGRLIAPFFYTNQILTIVFISDTANYLVRTVTLRFEQLLMTLALIGFTIFCYSVLTADYLTGSIISAAGIPHCEDLWECFMFVTSQGLRNFGGFGDMITEIEESNRGKYFGKFFFDLSFFILVNILSLNILYGIIIDTFAEMRERSHRRSKPGSPRLVLLEQVFDLPREQVRHRESRQQLPQPHQVPPQHLEVPLLHLLPRAKTLL